MCQWFGPKAHPDVRINLVQCICSPGGTLNVLVEFREHCLQISMVKVPCDYVNSLRIPALLVTNSVM